MIISHSQQNELFFIFYSALYLKKIILKSFNKKLSMVKPQRLFLLFFVYTEDTQHNQCKTLQDLNLKKWIRNMLRGVHLKIPNPYLAKWHAAISLSKQ